MSKYFAEANMALSKGGSGVKKLLIEKAQSRRSSWSQVFIKKIPVSKTPLILTHDGKERQCRREAQSFKQSLKWNSI
jgi:hypothetical protein